MAPTEKKTPKRVAYEFGGPLGVLAIMFGLPSVVNFLYAFCNHDVGCSVYPLATLDQVRAHFAVYGPLVERRDVVIVLGWFAYHVRASSHLDYQTENRNPFLSSRRSCTWCSPVRSVRVSSMPTASASCTSSTVRR